MDGLKTAVLSTVALIGYPLVGVLALLTTTTSSDGLMPLLVTLFVLPVVLTAITTLLSDVRLGMSVLLVFGTLATSFASLLVLIAIARAHGDLS